jgi:hypothetical protein
MLLIAESNSAEVAVKQAESTVMHAEQMVGAAFVSLSAAEKSGANVFSLGEILNAVLQNLTEAKRLFNRNQTLEAASLATRVIDDASAVAVRASELKAAAEIVHSSEFKNKLILSSCLVSLVVLSGFLGWKRFKDRYLCKMLNQKPEVVANES